MIKKRDGKYHLISHKGKTLGVHKTREEALKQEQAIEIAKQAKQLADGLGKYLAATEHDEKGRFTGPGGGGSLGETHAKEQSANNASEHAHGKTARTAGSQVRKDHEHAANAHQDAAALHKEAAAMHRQHAAQGGPATADHMLQADHHEHKAVEHTALVKQHRDAAAVLRRRDESEKGPRFNKSGNSTNKERRAPKPDESQYKHPFGTEPKKR